jgi:hypothetical protein
MQEFTCGINEIYKKGKRQATNNTPWIKALPNMQINLDYQLIPNYVPILL